jgi:pimeloyl-ACP methyl ester carboxylesterase
MIQRKITHQTVKVRDLDVSYREAGPKDARAVLLLHGFPTSSQMFRNLIPSLADRYRMLAPDYPGFGHSSMPSRDEFAYTFDNLVAVVEEFTTTLGVSKYALYVQDYGAPGRLPARPGRQAKLQVSSDAPDSSNSSFYRKGSYCTR